MLGVPDAAYRNWTLRLDLHQIAMFGGRVAAASEAEQPSQRDKVVITPEKEERCEGNAGMTVGVQTFSGQRLKEAASCARAFHEITRRHDWRLSGSDLAV